MAEGNALRASDEPVKVPATGAGDHDPAPVSVGSVSDAAALTASKRVVRNWLKDRFDLTIITGCTYAVEGLILGMSVLEYADKRALFRPLKPVPVRLCLKLVSAALLLLKLQNHILHRYLLRLNSQQAVEKLGNELTLRIRSALSLLDQGLQVQADLRRTLREAESALGAAEEASDV